MSYNEALRFVKKQKIPNGVTRRYTCPICGGYNTFGVTNSSGILSWNCFRASCPAKGMSDGESSISDIKQRLGGNEYEVNRLGAVIPDDLFSVNRPDLIEWLESVNSYESMIRGLVDIKYSPSVNRILFKLRDFQGYTGRKLDSNSFGPKWIKYGDSAHVFACGTGKTGVLVEDAPSACAVGLLEGYTGISLLGTTLTSNHKVELFTYSNLIVCLDPDAASKSITISESLQGIRPTTVKLIPDDLKYFKPDQIKQILSE